VVKIAIFYIIPRFTLATVQDIMEHKWELDLNGGDISSGIE